MANYETDEKIYALATAYYPSALAIIRTSGEGTIEALSSIFSAKEKLLKSKSNTLRHGYLFDSEGRKIDEVVLSVYHKGHGYDGSSKAAQAADEGAKKPGTYRNQ